MRSSRYLILAAALAVALAAQGCNRDYKAPKPKTDAELVTSFAVATLRW
jgi:hypothetical protein